MPLDPQIAGLLQLTEASTPTHQQTPAEARQAFTMLTVGFRKDEDVVPVATTEDRSVPGAEGELKARVYRPEGDGPFPVVAMFHGGGFVIGDLETHDNMARSICRGASAVVVSVDYRLAPEHPFPAGVEDALAATRWIAEHLEELGGDGRLAVAGDSAGGNFSAVVAQHVPGIAAQFLIYPAVAAEGDFPSREENGEGYFLDLATMGWFMDHYAPEGSDLRFSPLDAESLEGQPPTVLVTAEFDPLRDEGEAYAAALEKAGVHVVSRRYDGMIHGFFDMGGFSSGARAGTEDAIGLFKDLLAETSPS